MQSQRCACTLPRLRHAPPPYIHLNSHVVCEVLSELRSADVAAKTLWDAVEPFLDIAEVPGYLRETNQKITSQSTEGVISGVKGDEIISVWIQSRRRIIRRNTPRYLA